MSALLNPRLWIALGLAAALGFAGFFLYRAGKAAVRSEWNESKIKDSENARLLERAWQLGQDRAAAEHAKRQADMVADAGRVRDERDGLRGDVAALQQYARTSLEACNKSASALGAVFESCTEAYSGMAAAAQGHANDALMLEQAWPKKSREALSEVAK